VNFSTRAVYKYSSQEIQDVTTDQSMIMIPYYSF